MRNNACFKKYQQKMTSAKPQKQASTITIPSAIAITFLTIYILSAKHNFNLNNLLYLSKELFLKGDIWRLITYPLVHLNKLHLLGNILAILISGKLYYELQYSYKWLLFLFLLVTLLSPFPMMIITSMILLGASSTIYGIFSFGIFGEKKMFNKKNRNLLVSSLILYTITESLIYYIITKNINYFLEGLFHLFGIIFGIIIAIISLSIKKSLDKRKSICLRSIS